MIKSYNMYALKRTNTCFLTPKCTLIVWHTSKANAKIRRMHAAVIHFLQSNYLRFR